MLLVFLDESARFSASGPTLGLPDAKIGVTPDLEEQAAKTGRNRRRPEEGSETDFSVR